MNHFFLSSPSGSALLSATAKATAHSDCQCPCTPWTVTFPLQDPVTFPVQGPCLLHLHLLSRASCTVHTSFRCTERNKLKLAMPLFSDTYLDFSFKVSLSKYKWKKKLGLIICGFLPKLQNFLLPDLCSDE